VHLVLAGVGQQVSIGKPQLHADEPARDLIAEKLLKQGGAPGGLRHTVEPALEGIDARQPAQTEQPSGLLPALMLELLERADIAHGHQREHHEQAPTLVEQPQQTRQPRHWLTNTSRIGKTPA
jgi:hypothetical protein